VGAACGSCGRVFVDAVNVVVVVVAGIRSTAIVAGIDVRCRIRDASGRGSGASIGMRWCC
jgi:hypothetical protein